MSKMAEAMTENYRTGRPVKANPNNKFTAKRRRKYQEIMQQTGGDAGAALDYALQELTTNRDDIERYILSKSERPAQTIEDLAVQAYKLRCHEIDSLVKTMDISDGEAQIFLEDSESNDQETLGEGFGNYLGYLSAPIGVAATVLMGGGDNFQGNDVDSFIDPALVTGILNTAGEKINSADLRRAASGKNAGILGFLGTGGTKGYNALVAYFKDPANKDEKAKVLSGQITSTGQLRGYGGNVNEGGGNGIKVMAQDVIDQVRKAETKKAIKKALPFIIIGIIVIVLVTVLIARKNGNK